MLLLNTFKLRSLSQYLIRFVLGVSLIVLTTLSYSGVAQAAIDTTSAASKADAERINQRKEEAPHYPNWYKDQRSLESYMDEAGVGENGSDRARVSNQSSRGDDRGNLIERTQGRLKGMADTAKDNLQSSYRDNQSDASFDDIGDRASNRIEKAAQTFDRATRRAAEENAPINSNELR